MGAFGIGGSSSSSESSQQTTSASGLSKAATLGKKNKGAVNLGDGSVTTLAKGASLTINNPIDNTASTAAFKAIADATSEALAAVANAGQSAAQPLATALQTAATGNANVVDGGAAQASKTLLWLAAIAAAGVGIFFYFRK